MKKALLFATLGLQIVGTIVARADEWDSAWRAALMGAAVGAIVGHNSDDITTEVAVPAFAVAGALIGYGYDNGWYGHRDPYYYQDPYDPYPNRYRRNDPYAPYGYGYRDPYRDPYRSRYGVGYREPRRKPAKVRPAPVTPGDPHPGVELVGVPVTLPGGTIMELRLIKLANGYIGPQGEHYDTLPDSAELTARYVTGAR